MLIKIDCREQRLIAECEKLNELHTIKVESLPLGDIIICDNSDESNIKDLLMIERKSLNDLASSIADGRYTEQSFRLSNDPLHNHHIIYLIEGNLGTWTPRFGRINKKAIYSAMTTIQLYKGFSLYRTNGICETAEWLINMTTKVGKEGNKLYYDKCTDMSGSIQDNYNMAMKRVKKNNITEDNIGEIMISQIPSVSSNVAAIIMHKYKTIGNLINELQQDNTCLDNMKYPCSKTDGKERKINKTSIENIKKYLLYNVIH